IRIGPYRDGASLERRPIGLVRALCPVRGRDSDKARQECAGCVGGLLPLHYQHRSGKPLSESANPVERPFWRPALPAPFQPAAGDWPPKCERTELLAVVGVVAVDIAQRAAFGVAIDPDCRWFPELWMAHGSDLRLDWYRNDYFEFGC